MMNVSCFLLDKEERFKPHPQMSVGLDRLLAEEGTMSCVFADMSDDAFGRCESIMRALRRLVSGNASNQLEQK